MKSKDILSEPEVTYRSISNGNGFKLIDMVRKGIDHRSFTSIVDKHPFTTAEWCQFLGVSDRTLQRYKRDKKSFDATTSEKILGLTMLFKYGEHVFEDKDNFHEWLSLKNPALGGVTPKSLLDTGLGIEMVKGIITRIEHGVYS